MYIGRSTGVYRPSNHFFQTEWNNWLGFFFSFIPVTATNDRFFFLFIAKAFHLFIPFGCKENFKKYKLKKKTTYPAFNIYLFIEFVWRMRKHEAHKCPRALFLMASLEILRMCALNQNVEQNGVGERRTDRQRRIFTACASFFFLLWFGFVWARLKFRVQQIERWRSPSQRCCSGDS